MVIKKQLNIPEVCWAKITAQRSSRGTRNNIVVNEVLKVKHHIEQTQERRSGGSWRHQRDDWSTDDGTHDDDYESECISEYSENRKPRYRHGYGIPHPDARMKTLQDHLAQFYEKMNAWWTATLLPEILGQPAPVGAKSPILNRYLLVAPQP